MEPSINPPAEIDDPEDFKPADWDDKEKIPDPEATKVRTLAILTSYLSFFIKSVPGRCFAFGKS